MKAAKNAVGTIGLVGICVGCNSGSGSYPLANITLSSPSGTAGNVASGNGTFAYSRLFLAPPVNDAPGTVQTLSFDSEPGYQDVLAFDVDWASPLLNPDPSIDFVPIPAGVIGVRDGTSKSYALPFSTQHLVRIWRGTCRGSAAWADVFAKVSNEWLSGLQGLGSAAREYEAFSPQFIGAEDHIEHGFAWEGTYDLALFTFNINPAFSFSVADDTGLMRVTPLHTGFVGVAGKPFGDPQAFKDGVESTLKADVPQGIEKAVHDQARIVLNTDQAAIIVCDPSQALATRQKECFGEWVGTAGLALSLTTTLFKKGLAATPGFTDSTAETFAEVMTSALETRNFDCVQDDPTKTTGHCELHPVFERVNTLPTKFEFVLAGDSFSPNDLEFRKQVLYTYIPDVAKSLVPDAPVPTFCEAPGTIPQGETLFWQPQ
jgi:hypothetical protein